LESTPEILIPHEACEEFRDPSKRGKVMNLRPSHASFYSAPQTGEKGSATFSRCCQLINPCPV